MIEQKRAVAVAEEREHRRGTHRQAKLAAKIEKRTEEQEHATLMASYSKLRGLLAGANPLSKYDYEKVKNEYFTPKQIESYYPAAKQIADYQFSGDEKQRSSWEELTPENKQLVLLIIDKYNESLEEADGDEAAA